MNEKNLVNRMRGHALLLGVESDTAYGRQLMRYTDSISLLNEAADALSLIHI